MLAGVVVASLDGNEGLPELVRPLRVVLDLVTHAPARSLAPTLRDVCERARRTVEAVAGRTLQVRGNLRLQRRQERPRMIRSLEPEIEDNFRPGKVPGQEDADEVRRLQREFRREQRAVARELKLDSAFLQRTKQAEKTKRDEERAAKTKEVMAFLQSQAQQANDAVRQGVAAGGGSGSSKMTKAERRLRKRGLL